MQPLVNSAPEAKSLELPAGQARSPTNVLGFLALVALLLLLKAMGQGHLSLQARQWRSSARRFPLRGEPPGLGMDEVTSRLAAPTLLADIVTQQAPDLREGTVNRRCQGPHADRGSESNEHDDQHVLNHALAFLFAVQPGQDVNN